MFEAGESDGVLFIAMRYVRGGDVRSLIDRVGALPPGRAAEIVSQVASALDAAHARGLVHRDVKPGNMLLEASAAADRPDHVYLSDFGLSKAALSAGVALTASGQFLGTLDYVAPEQIEGRPLDGRTDEYALACSAFEMLCGEPPFRRDQSVSVMYAHLSEPPPQIRSLRPDLPARARRGAGQGDGEGTGRPVCQLPRVRGRAARRPRSAPPRPAAAGTSGHRGRDARLPAPKPDGGDAGRYAGDAGRAGAPVHRAVRVRLPDRGGLTEQAGSPRRRPVRAAAARCPRRRRSGRPAPRAAGGKAARPWWRSPVPVAVIVIVALAVAAGAFWLAHGSDAAMAQGRTYR